MTKRIAVAVKSVPFSFDGIKVEHVEKGEKFEGKKAELLVSFDFAKWTNAEPEPEPEPEQELTLEQAQALAEKLQKEAEEAAAKVEQVGNRGKQKAQKEAEEAAKAAADAWAKVEELLNA